jgi:hypothetical protein
MQHLISQKKLSEKDMMNMIEKSYEILSYIQEKTKVDSFLVVGSNLYSNIVDFINLYNSKFKNMNNDILTINGLLDGISVVEKDNKQEQPSITSDILYNDKEPINLKLDIPFHDEVCEFTKL